MRNISLGVPFLCFLFLSCSETDQVSYQIILGETMGTTYSIKYRPTSVPLTKIEIDRELVDLNAALSTYEVESVISKFNRSPVGIKATDISSEKLAEYFFENVQIAKEVHDITEGFFEPTVMPLVNYWGFGYEKRIERRVIDSAKIDSILMQMGFDKIIFEKGTSPQLIKTEPGMQIDFSAVAKGYAVDQLAELLTQEKEIEHFFIDIGGENRAKGLNAEGGFWRSGIGTPDESASPTSFDFVVHLRDQAIATSGNYRNFYKVNGKYISHTINPKTGYFERNDLLSVSIIAKECARADALATACMAMGFERAKELVDRLPNIFGVLIYQGASGETEFYQSEELNESVHRLK